MSKQRVNYLTVAQNFALEAACAVLSDAGFSVYMVGSAMERPDWFDVDLRCIMPDDEFDALFKGARLRLKLMNAALSEWLRSRTSLPIDFQFQRMSTSQEEFAGRPRNAMGIYLQGLRTQDEADAAESAR